MKQLIFMSIVVVLAFVACKEEDTVVPTDGKYFPKVKSIITNNCMGCHDSSGSWQGRPVKFDTDFDITSSYESIKRAVSDPATPQNRRMPVDGTLTTAEIETIVLWFNKGGKTTD